MNGLRQYIDARRVACEHEDARPTIRGVSLVPGPNTFELADCLYDALPTEPCGMLLDEPGDYEPTLLNCVGIVGAP